MSEEERKKGYSKTRNKIKEEKRREESSVDGRKKRFEELKAAEVMINSYAFMNCIQRFLLVLFPFF